MFIAALFSIAKHGNNLKVHGQIHGLRRCGTYTQWNTTQAQKNEIMHLQEHGCN